MTARDPAERQRRIEELFGLAIELEASEREAFLDRHCGTDAELRRELSELLAQDDEGTKDFLQSPLISAEAERSATGVLLDELVPSVSEEELDPYALPPVIDRFRLMEKLGEGGMGIVFRAQQTEPVRREVALKVLKSGVGARRFETERQALARMDHPHVARILDGGSLEDGRPYLVMQVVDGVPIDTFCDARALSLGRRLELFGQVCAAVQHAHQKGIVHRDLKAENVLVEESQGEARPKLIDFGIALEEPHLRGEVRSSAEGEPTEEREVLGTLATMSPEQARGELEEIDTRTDVYSLGVLLYELITGSLPLPAERLSGKSLEELRELVAGHRPEPASKRVAGLVPEEAQRRARRRGLEPQAWTRALRGDLDAICAKAMARRPEDRYGSALELQTDLERHAAFLPVSAREPGPLHRAGLFVRRHRVPMVACAVLLLTLVAGTLGTLRGLVAARRASAEASESERIARREAQAAQRTTRFLIDTIALADPESTLDPDQSLETLLRRTGAQVGERFRNDPDAEARLRSALGRALYSLGDLAAAEDHLARAQTLVEAGAGLDARERFELQLQLARCRSDSQREELPDLFGALEAAAEWVGEPLADVLRDCGVAFECGDEDEEREELERLRGRVDEQLAPRDADRAVLGAVLGLFGQHRSSFDGGEMGLFLLRMALKFQRDALPEASPEIARTSTALCSALLERGETAEAEERVRELLRTFEVTLPEDHGLLLEARSLLGAVLSRAGRGAEARSWLEGSRDRLVAQQGERSRAALLATHRLLRHLHEDQAPAAGRASEVERVRHEFARAVSTSETTRWSFDFRSAALGSRAELEREGLTGLVADGALLVLDPEPPEGAGRRLWETASDAYAEDDPRLLIFARLLQDEVVPYVATIEEARELQAAILPVLRRAGDAIPSALGYALWSQAILWAEEDSARAEALLDEAIETKRRDLRASSSELILVLEERALFLAELGRPEEALLSLDEALPELVAALGAAHPGIGILRTAACRVALEAGRLERADEELEAALAREGDPQLDNNMAWPIVVRPELSAELYEKALALSRRSIALEPEDEAALHTLGMARLRVGELDEAREILERVCAMNDGLDPTDWAALALVRDAQGLGSAARDAAERMRGAAAALGYVSEDLEQLEREVAERLVR